MKSKSLFNIVKKPNTSPLGKCIMEIDYATAVNFLMPRHYSGRVPQIMKAFGWYDDNFDLVAVCTFGKPASKNICDGVCGDKWTHNVIELNRLCRLDTWDKPLSHLVATCLRILSAEDWIVVSYSDTAMNHHGYIYQATNFIYTGKTRLRTDRCNPDGSHARHVDFSLEKEYRKIRSVKHRYVYFCTKNKKLKKQWLQDLRFPIEPYPKGDNSEDYPMGTRLKEQYIDGHSPYDEE